MLWLVADVELRHLATMAAIAEAGTFGRAGSRLGYPQSSISQQIAALEKSVGGPARTPRLRPALTRGIYLHWPARFSQSPLAVRAIEIAAEVAAEVSADLVKQ